MEKSIYELGLNETVFIENTGTNGFIESTSVTRVPGGWIYINFAQYSGERETALTSNAVFVPYSEEFAPVNRGERF